MKPTDKQLDTKPGQFCADYDSVLRPACKAPFRIWAPEMILNGKTVGTFDEFRLSVCEKCYADRLPVKIAEAAKQLSTADNVKEFAPLPPWESLPLHKERNEKNS